MDLKEAKEKLCAVKYGHWLAAGALIMLLLSLAWPEGGSNGADRQETRLSQVLSNISGAGRVEVALYYQDEQDDRNTEKIPAGAVIVAQGGREIGVRLQLIRAVSTLLGLSENRICVFFMDEGGG